MKRPLITVIMPAYNAQATIEKALQSIRMQDISQQEIEILVVDGGSIDATRTIAVRYGATVLDNLQRLPEPAKMLGLAAARGRYVVWLDTDEVLVRPDQLSIRLKFLQEHPQVKCIVCDNQVPGEGCGISASYLCLCGDPFTQFVYRRRGGVLATFASAIISCEQGACVLQFSPGEMTPIGDGGSTLFDWDYVKETFGDKCRSQRFACAVFEKICEKTGCCGCIAGDDIIHYARASLGTYLSKLKFRVINNIFHPEQSGYSARTQNRAGRLAARKYGFILYAAAVIGPAWDSVHMALRYHDSALLLHFVYVYYVCLCIVISLLQRMVGRTRTNRQYG